MKSLLSPTKWWLLLLIPFLIQGVCSKEDENDDSNATNADQYVTWQINGNSGSLQHPKDSFSLHRQAPTTVAYISSYDMSKQFDIFFQSAEAPGNYQTNYFQMLSNGRYYVQSSTPLQVNVTTFGPTGQYIIGTYSGTVKDSTSSTNVSISGKFRFKHQ